MKKNFLYTAISIGSRLVTGIFLFIFLARIWGPEDFGLFTFLFSLFTILALIVDFGFSNYLLREIGLDSQGASATIMNALWLKTSLALIYLLVSSSVLFVFDDMVPANIAIPLLLASLVLSFSEFFIAPLRALGRYDVETVIVTSSNIIQFIIVIFTAWYIGTIESVAWAMLMGRIIYLFSAFYSSKTLIGFKSVAFMQIQSPLKMMRKIWPYGVDGILSTVWSQLDVVIVRSLYGAHVVGLYSAGQKIVQGAAAIAPVVGNVMIPKLAKLSNGPLDELKVNVYVTSALMWGIGIALSLPLMLFPEQLADLLYGEAYNELAQLFPFFGAILLMRYAAGGSGAITTAVGLQKKRVIVQVVGLSTFLFIVLLINKFSLSIEALLLGYGASIVIILIMYTYYLKNFLISLKEKV